MKPPVRIAMWSGPRNLSTAMMRSFGNRKDAIVIDEPFYAAYLHLTGLEHPMREEVVAAGPIDPAIAVEGLLRGLPAGKSVFYQKHMTHHMLPEIDRSWFAQVKHAFLIRSPADVVASYQAKRESISLPDIGIVQQVEIFDEISRQSKGHHPVVIDSRDILNAPEAILIALCRALEITYDQSMLSWPSGSRETDGVWAAHWYGSVDKSTGFAAPARQQSDRTFSDESRELIEQAQPYYDYLARHRISNKG
ncbi:MAG: hypothetical protein ABJN26_27365 [Stappiaceae bacterium]